MTYQDLEQDCDDSVHQGRGPWDDHVGVEDYVHVLHVRRQECSQPARTDFEIFRELVDKWRRETWHLSSVNRRVSHPAYLKIIGLGAQAIPWILQELRQAPDYWFPALEALTRDNFSPKADTMKELCEAWLAWGEENAQH